MKLLLVLMCVWFRVHSSASSVDSVVSTCADLKIGTCWVMMCPVSFWACIFELSTFFWLLDHQFSFGIKIHSCHKLESHSHGCKVQLILRQWWSSAQLSSVNWCTQNGGTGHSPYICKFLCVDHDPLKIQHKRSNSWTELWQTCTIQTRWSPQHGN